ncbi:phosphate ABC transporter substrate-binding protein [Pontiellaceae bacterium B12219]|nr:phosphate ABC transporter substrate-binding protein [Pontiellaceae bacterium B12219]
MKKQILTATAALALAGAAHASETIVIDGSTTVGPIAKAFAEYYMAANPEVNITVSESGSGNGAKAMVNGTCDVAIMSRPMKDSEFKAAADHGAQPVAHVVALDGLPILVHPSNPVQDLTVEQIRKIFLGEISNWSQVGGPNKEIVTISRDTNSGTYETFAGLVMNKEKIGEKCEYVGSNGAIRQRVQTTPAAIGYAGLGFVDKTVKALKVNGIYPSPETVQTGEYPIARPLFMYTNGYPKLGSSLYQFMTIHLTEDGQEMVEEIGFVPVTAY